MARTPRLAGNGARARCDIRVEDHGSVVLLRPITVLGQDWLDDHFDPDALAFGGAVVCEPRYAAHTVRGMQDDGLVVA